MNKLLYVSLIYDLVPYRRVVPGAAVIWQLLTGSSDENRTRVSDVTDRYSNHLNYRAIQLVRFSKALTKPSKWKKLFFPIVRDGDSEGTRTPDLLRDRQALYSSELQSHISWWDLCEALTKPWGKLPKSTDDKDSQRVRKTWLPRNLKLQLASGGAWVTPAYLVTLPGFEPGLSTWEADLLNL